MPELPGPGHHRLALREAAEQRDQRQLVDRHRHLVGVDPGRVSWPWRATIAPRGSPPSVGSSSTSIAAPIRLRIPSSPIRVGLSPTPSSRTSLPRHDRRGDDGEGRRGEVAGHADPPGLEALDRPDRDPAGRAAAGDGRGPQVRPTRPSRRPPSACARCGPGSAAGSVTRGLALGQQAGEQHARLHLGARDGQPVVDPVQSGAARPRSGGRRPSRHSTSAPISRSGSATRSTGRRRIDSSPSSVHDPARCPASHPGSIRSRVPALPTSISRAGPADRARAARPDALDPNSQAARRRRPRVDLGARASRTAPSVALVSAASRYPSTSVSPSPIAAISAARWLIDLSGRRPQRRPTAGPRGRSRVTRRDR